MGRINRCPFARWAQDGISPWGTKSALGHTTLAMTNGYVDSAAVDLSAAFAAGRGSANSNGNAGELSLIGRILELVADKYGHVAAQEMLESAGVKSKLGSLSAPRRTRRTKG